MAPPELPLSSYKHKSQHLLTCVGRGPCWLNSTSGHPCVEAAWVTSRTARHRAELLPTSKASVITVQRHLQWSYSTFMLNSSQVFQKQHVNTGCAKAVAGSRIFFRRRTVSPSPPPPHSSGLLLVSNPLSGGAEVRQVPQGRQHKPLLPRYPLQPVLRRYPLWPVDALAVGSRPAGGQITHSLRSVGPMQPIPGLIITYEVHAVPRV